MKTWKPMAIWSLCIALLAGCGGGKAGGTAAPATGPQAVTPVQAYGFLHVCGNRICSQAGQPVQLRGMSLFWSNTGWGGERFYDARTVATLASDWHATVVRAAMGVEENGGYLASDAANRARVRVVVDAAIARGIYVIVDWHAHGLHQPEAEAFFGEMARAYARVPNLIWETYNEPKRQDWSGELKPYHEAVIRKIRAAGSKNLVVVGSPTWSQDVDVAVLDRIKSDDNVAYALHFYAYSHKKDLRDRADDAMKRGIALLVTEYGTCHSSGNGNFDPVESKRWADWMDANQISSANWSLNDKPETASALVPGASASGPWPDDQLTESGKWARAYVAAGASAPAATAP